MTTYEKTDTFSENFDVTNSDSYNSDKLQHEFYSPVCKSGYLTPLQRKRLREKRCFDVGECREEVDLRNLKNIKKCLTPKIKKGDKISEGSKRKQINSKKRSNVPGVQCVVAKIFTKTSRGGIKEKKFFKTSPSKRLQNVNFTMPLVLKKNCFPDFDKVIKEFHSGSKKLVMHKESNSLQPLNSSDDEFDVSSKTKNHIHPYVINLGSTMLASHTNSNLCRNEFQNSALTESHENACNPPKSKEGFIFDFEWPSDDIFLKRQERARTLKKQNILKEPNTHLEIEEINQSPNKCDQKGGPVKFYPIFNIPKRKICEDAIRIEKTMAKFVKDSSNGGEQMVIDAGQKEIGPKICHSCSMIYTIGHEEDERLHSDYHNMYLTNLKFPGWKEENIIGEYCNGRVIMVRHNDKSWKLKKIEDILMMANRDLGFPTAGYPSKSDFTFLLFISNEKRIVGCVVAEPISLACKVMLADDKSQINRLQDSEKKVWRIGNWYSSSESVPAICGINRIWVSQEFRRHKVASRMVDCLRCHFVHGHIINIRELAFTDPSTDGREFAAAYTGTDHFLVYKL